MKKTTVVICVASVVLAAGTANAAVFPFSIDVPGGPDGKEFIASATVDVEPTQVIVTLTNGTANPRSAAETLTGFKFTGVDTAGLFISSEVANFITVTGTTAADVTSVPTPATFVPNSTNTGKWRVSDEGFGNGITLNWHPGPDMAIIGPDDGTGAYSDSNASLQGNHNPFINQTATFTLNRPAGFPDTITSGTFYFNTDMSTSYGGGPPGGGTPEPASLGLLGAGAVGLLLRRRR